MLARGERFVLDLDAQGEETVTTQQPPTPFDFVGDIKERITVPSSFPRAPDQKAAGTGFPAHRKRNVIMSRFKAERKAENVSPLSEKQQIDKENRDRIAQMSPAEIEEARQDLMTSLNPAVLQRMLARANISESSPPVAESDPSEPKPKSAKKVTFVDADQQTKTLDTRSDSNSDFNKQENAVDEEHSHTLEAPQMHWPKPPQPPDLDPSAPNFLTDLHEKFFPNLAPEPEKLDWMRTPSTNTYSPTANGLDPKDIRFSFSGALIPPSLAAEIPVSAGLHHHGEAPDAAGYTIPELGILARSTVAAQRCMAFQTLGRILFRLGRGEFGNPSLSDDDRGELARGLWDLVHKGSVVDICISESEGKGPGGGRHVSAKAYATEAVWLWQKGGGRRWKAE